MIDPNLVFEVTRWLARIGWLILLLSLFVPRTRPHVWPVTQFVIPAITCLAYVLLVVDGFEYVRIPASFESLKGIGDLYAHPGPLAASWLHFLALDLFAGTWMVRDGLKLRLPTPLIVVCLPFTYLLGPSGLLLYILLRFALRGRAARDADAA
jgi:ABA4-like protein